MEVEPDINEEEIKQMALKVDNVKRYTSEQDIKKIIVVPGKNGQCIAVGK